MTNSGERGRIRVGVGGWTYEPWRGTFFPPGLRPAEELRYASRRLSAIEVNGTFYRTQTPATFAKWAADTPDNFVFALKAPRYAVGRRDLGEAGPAIARFVDSGIAELGPKLGPINWQLPPTKRFDAGELAAFLAMLPASVGARPLRHALEVRHESFLAAEALALVQAAGVSLVVADSDVYPVVPEPTSDLVYARLQRARAEEPAGYPEPELAAWAARARAWAAEGRSVFVFMINGAKERAPAAALALIAKLGTEPDARQVRP